MNNETLPNIFHSIWITIRNKSSKVHGPMQVCTVATWEKSSPAEKILWVHRRCPHATGCNPFEFVAVEQREDPSLHESARKLNAAWTKSMDRKNNLNQNISWKPRNQNPTQSPESTQLGLYLFVAAAPPAASTSISSKLPTSGTGAIWRSPRMTPKEVTIWQCGALNVGTNSMSAASINISTQPTNEEF